MKWTAILASAAAWATLVHASSDYAVCCRSMQETSDCVNLYETRCTDTGELITASRSCLDCICTDSRDSATQRSHMATATMLAPDMWAAKGGMGFFGGAGSGIH